MWAVISRFILSNRLVILLILFGLTLFMGFNARDVQLSYDFAKILPDDDPDYRSYLQFKKTFGEDGSVLVIGIKDTAFYQKNKFNDWYSLSRKIKQIDGIEEVVSVARIYNLVRNDSLQRFDFLPILKDTIKYQQQLDSLKEVILNLGFYKNLVHNPETGVHLMAITFDKAKLNTKSRIGIVDSIKLNIDHFAQKYHLEVHYSGLPYIRTAITRKVASELFLFLGLAILVTGLILFLLFRSYKIVLFSILVVIVGVIWSIGTISLFHYKITILTGLIPPLIIVIGVPNSILLLNKYHNEFFKHKNQTRALRKMVERIGVTTFLANVTTAIGFGVFYFTNSAVLMEFGLVAAINVMVTYAISLLLIPIVFSYLPPPAIKKDKHITLKSLTLLLEKVDYWVHHYRWRIYLTIIAIVCISIYGITRITAVGYVVDDLPKKDPIYTDLKFFEKNFKGVLPFEIFINTQKANGALSYNTLLKIDRLQKLLKGYPEFSKPLSVIEAIKFSYQAYRGGEGKYYQFPKNPTQLAELADFAKSSQSKQNSFKSFLDKNKQITRVSVQMADIGSRRMAELVRELKPRIDSIFNYNLAEQNWLPKNERYEIKLTGNSLIFLKGNDYLIQNLQESVLLAIILISLIMITLFMSFRMIAVSILPSLIPLIITAGLMGFFNIPLKPSTILIFSIAFGISSDQTIYFLTKYRQELKCQNLSISKTVSATIRETGLSMIYTAAILFCGFSIFTASHFGGTAALGILISITLLMAMCCNLILLPAFLLSLEKRLTSKAFLQDPLIEIYDEEEDIEHKNLHVRKNEENCD